MALLGKIRNQFGWLMVVLVVVGIGGFLIGDVTQWGGGAGSGMNFVGKINGEKINPSRIEEYVESPRYAGLISEEARATAWEQVIQDIILEQQTRAAGLTVTQKEMGELFVGANISPVVVEEMGDPATGMVDRNQIRAMLEAMDNPEMMGNLTPEQQAEQRKLWASLEKRVYNERLSAKYGALLQKAVYTPTWLATSEYNLQNQTFDLSFVRVPFSAVTNDQAPVTDEELKAYIEANPKKYKRDASASIEFVVFDVVPSAKDTADYSKEMQDMAAELRTLTTSKDDSAFFVRQDGDMSFAFLSKDDLDESPDLKDSIFGSAKGSTFGPYIHNNSYKLVKIMDAKDLSDSLRFRRILYQMNRTSQESAQASFKFVDSLKTLLVEGKVSFDSLAKQHSIDVATKDKGGDMGFVGRELRPGSTFGANDFLFFEAKKDSFYILNTPSGDIQLVQVLDYKLNGKKGLRLGTVTKPIIPSEQTTREIEASVVEFLTQNRTYEQFQKVAQERGLRRATAGGLEVNGYSIQGLGKSSTAAEIIRWAHKEAKDKEVAPRPFAINNDELNYISQFIAPVLIAKTPEGLATLDDVNVRQEVDRIVRNKKKAEVLKKALAGVTTLDAVAQKYGVQVETSKALAYGVPFLGQTVEPKVAAVANILPANQLSAPIAGNEGIYVINVNAKTAAPALGDPKMASVRESQRMAGRFLGMVIPALKEKSDIEDNRSQFY